MRSLETEGLPLSGWVTLGVKAVSCSWCGSSYRDFNGLLVCDSCDPTDKWAWHIYEGSDEE